MIFSILKQQLQKPPAERSGGFTLIELMVSITIFGIVATISVGTLLVMIDANRKAQSVSSAMTNLSFVVDNITRNMRTGYDYACNSSTDSELLPSIGTTRNCSGSENLIAFTDGRTGERIGFRLNNTRIERRVTGTDTRKTQWLPVTADNIRVDSFKIVALNTDKFYGGSSNTLQPRVLLTIAGVVNPSQESETKFNLQTEVTQRVLDY